MAHSSAGLSTARGAAAMPLSARKAEPLDLSTVERRGQGSTSREPGPKPARPHNLPEAPTFRPTMEEFRDPFVYMRKLQPVARQYGIIKIVPPDEWNPDFAIDTELFHFRTRRQELNSVEGSARVKQNYLEGLKKFHKQRGVNVARLPSVDKRPLDLDELRRAVETRGGFEAVCKGKKWAEIGRDLGYSGKIMSSLSTSLKNSYQKFCQPYEEYLRVAKPGVYQQLELEKGGPYTPSPTASPLKRSDQHTPSSVGPDSPAVLASTTLNNQLSEPTNLPLETLKPFSVGFTAVNAAGFTSVNAPTSTSSSFTAVNIPNGGPVRETTTGESTPQRSADSPMPSMKETPDLKPPEMGEEPLANGHSVNHLKRQLSDDPDGAANGDSDSGGRRSKRLKKDAPPTVTGSQMLQPRLPTPRPRAQPAKDGCPDRASDRCEACGGVDGPAALLVCDSCESAYHKQCIESPLKAGPGRDWHCHKCLVGTGEFGFEDGEVYSLKQFEEKADRFKQDYFRAKMPFDPILNCKRQVTEEDVGREFWRLVENPTESVEVEYGADIHSTTHGSGFPTVEKCPQDPYSTDPWNLNRLPLHGESLFRHIKSDVSGMTVPWLYVGMCFSTFCWHNEDHYSYSVNYQHLGATKTWYGIPGEDAEKFENAMRTAVPELFEREPDLLFQLVTLLPPEQLQKAGVRVYALDQRAGQFVVTYPQAYHAGFNHGFNFNEAVNFAPPDWEPYGEAGVQRLQDFRRQPCFSHDEMLFTAASRDHTIKTARWLSPALKRAWGRETAVRESFLARFHAADLKHSCTRSQGPGPKTSHECERTEENCNLAFIVSDQDLTEEEYSCAYCKAYTYLSRYVCTRTSKVMCLLHAGTFGCCDLPDDARYACNGGEHVLYIRMSDEALTSILTKVEEKGKMPEAWAEKLDRLLDDDPMPALKSLRSLLTEGEKIPWDLPRLPELKKYVDRCNEWVEEAMNYITRKQQNRRKNERAWRKGSNTARAAELEERDKELRKVDNIRKLLAAADQLSFDCPEIQTLRERADSIAEFQRDAQTVLHHPHSHHTTQELDDLVELGKSFNVDIPEVEQLDRLVRQMKWYEQARERRNVVPSLKDMASLIKQAVTLGIPEADPYLLAFQEQKQQGELWEAKAKEVMSAESVHYQQLDALSRQAASLPVSPDTLAQVDAILKKQRDAQDHIVSLYERSQDPDFLKRPRYKEVREAMEALNELNSKPNGTIDLEREQKRHEDWMRRGKKLFGKANAPLHILLAHMQTVEGRNQACLEVRDAPRVPVEPASRQQTPDPDAESSPQTNNGYPDVFCICRKIEAGMMIECELCHEWYHGKCLKIARGKVKDEDKYTCPICDWRVKIPRDAARPKLEDLMGWQEEIPGLPFQPEEEECLRSIIDHALDFRKHVSTYLNPIMSNPDELGTQRFYLRKVEGADILLSEETNFLRQEVHKWAPVAPEAPPRLEVSLSTRKPRPTKQQKLMQQYNVSTPDDLPAHLRTRTHVKNRKSTTGVDGQPLQGGHASGGPHHHGSKPHGAHHQPKQPRRQSQGDGRSHTPPGLPRHLSIGGAGAGPASAPNSAHPSSATSAHASHHLGGPHSASSTRPPTAFGYPDPHPHTHSGSVYVTSPLFAPGERRGFTPPLHGGGAPSSAAAAIAALAAAAAAAPARRDSAGHSSSTSSASGHRRHPGPAAAMAPDGEDDDDAAAGAMPLDPALFSTGGPSVSYAPMFTSAAPPVASMFAEFTRADDEGDGGASAANGGGGVDGHVEEEEEDAKGEVRGGSQDMDVDVEQFLN